MRFIHRIPLPAPGRMGKPEQPEFLPALRAGRLPYVEDQR
jgi:hypothetical protein